MTTDTRRIADSSTLVGLIRATVTRLRAWLAASWLASTTKTTTNAFESATDTSGLAGVARAIAHWTRNAYLFRWLTTEPDPDVIVIDLRETYTVGPIIALLDRLAPVVGRIWQGSVICRITERLQTSAKREWLADSKTVQLLVAALEPPEPPNRDRRK